LSTDQYDAWLIGWPPGTGLDLHDHGGSTGAFTVVAGTLHETIAVGAALSTHRLRAGETARFGVGHVHAVRNDGDRPATSVHVYSPPLQSMDFYERGAAGVVSVDHDPGDWPAVA
jgi:quercetin dioxygenase-like cupin family protein